MQPFSLNIFANIYKIFSGIALLYGYLYLREFRIKINLEKFVEFAFCL